MMETLFYLLKVILCSAVFFLYYSLALKNKLFHQWNRFYLLASVVLSLLAPLVQTTIYHYREASASKTIQLLKVVESANNYLDEVTIGNGQSSMAYGWIYWLYFLVSLVILVLFVQALLQVARLIRTHLVKVIDRIYFVNTKVPGTPFSFLRYIFWNEEIDINSATGRQIFEHELVHVKERHSIDKLFLQLVLVFFWCNPFFWFIRRELKMIHEFIADKRSVAHHGEAAFASMVLQAAYPSRYNQLTNQFFQTSIKRRLMMLKKMQRPAWHYISRIVALPLLVITVAAFTIRTKTVHTPLMLEKPITVIIDAGHGKMKNYYTGARVGNTYEDVINLAIAKKIRDENHNPNIHIILTRDGEENVDLHKRVEIAEANKADLYISIHVNAAEPQTGSNGSKVVNELSSGMEVIIPREGHAFHASSIVLGSSVVNELKNIYPTDEQIKTNQVAFVLKQSPCPAALIEFGYLTNPEDRAFITKAENQEKLAAAVLASIEQYAVAAQAVTPVMDTVPVSKEIRSIHINKNENNITIEYSNGNKEILTMEEARKRNLLKDEAGEKVKVTVKEKPLYVVNGEIYHGDPDKIDPISIESINIIKDGPAIKKYGEKGKRGVVEITLKKGYSIDQPVSGGIIPAKNVAHIDQGEWKKFLETNLGPVLERVSKKAPEGRYTAMVKFMVNTDGSLTDINVENDPGYGIGEEVKNLFQISPRWEPAVEDGRPVNSYHTQPITLVITK